MDIADEKSKILCKREGLWLKMSNSSTVITLTRALQRGQAILITFLYPLHLIKLTKGMGI